MEPWNVDEALTCNLNCYSTHVGAITPILGIHGPRNPRHHGGNDDIDGNAGNLDDPDGMESWYGDESLDLQLQLLLNTGCTTTDTGLLHCTMNLKLVVLPCMPLVLMLNLCKGPLKRPLGPLGVLLLGVLLRGVLGVLVLGVHGLLSLGVLGVLPLG